MAGLDRFYCIHIESFFTDGRARYASSGCGSVPFPGLARPRSANQCHDCHQLHQAGPQDSPLRQRQPPLGALQCWCGKDGHLHHTGLHVGEDKGERRARHLPFCHAHTKSAGTDGADTGKYTKAYTEADL